MFSFVSICINEEQIRTIFDNVDNESAFAMDLEYFLSERLSYYDLVKYEGEKSAGSNGAN